MYGVDTVFPGSSIILIAVAGLVVAAVWAIVAGSRNGGAERNDRIPQFYGYTICMISLLWSLTSVTQIADGVLSLSAPEMRSMDSPFEASVTSFEAFRNSYDQSRRVGMPYPPQQLDTIPERELRKRYESLRADRISRGVFLAKKRIITNSITLVLALGLFAFHWRWVKRNSAAAAA